MQISFKKCNNDLFLDGSAKELRVLGSNELFRDKASTP